MRVVDVRELTALEREVSCPYSIVACVEVRILNVLMEVGDQELTSMTVLCGAEPFYGLVALATVADLEEATIRGGARTFDFSVVDEINRVRDAIVPALVTIHIFWFLLSL